MSAIAMDLQDMRDFVRDALDTDDTDLADSLLDRYIIDGSNRIESYSDEWTFRAVDYTISAVADTQAYDIRSDARVAGVDYPILDIVDVRGPTWGLKPKDHLVMRRNISAASTGSGNPREFSLWGDSIYLWPVPTEAADFSITGYRGGFDWVEVNGTPDFPVEFHELIAWWALNRAHAREGDPQMADFYRAEFEPELRKRADKYLGGLDAQPLVVGESNSVEDFYRRNGLGPLLWDWE